jgi:uncharacterized SAM-binding protein YcdF (DUF218 family)
MRKLMEHIPAASEKRTRRRLRYVLAASGAIVLMWVLRQPVLTSLGAFLVCSEPPQKADLIYVLAGDFLGNRVLVAAGLGAQGYARQVIVGGGPYQDSYQGELAIRFAVEHGYRRDLFVPVRLRARSTIEEAIELRPIFERLGVKRIILVTTNYHSRRAALVFHLFLPGFQFSTVAAPDKSFDTDSWWRTQKERRIFFLEYSKIVGTLLRRVKLVPAGEWG